MRYAAICSYHLPLFSAALSRDAVYLSCARLHFSDSNVCECMAKKLIIAEKPSVAGDIAARSAASRSTTTISKATNTSSRRRSATCSRSVAPEEYEVKRGKWTFAHLPVIPPHFDLRPIEKTEDAPEAAHASSSSARTSTALHQCVRRRARGRVDFPLHRAVREDRPKPIQRLWLQSMTPAAIRDGFEQSARRRARCCRWPMPPCAAPKPTGWWASTARAR